MRFTSVPQCGFAVAPPKEHCDIWGPVAALGPCSAAAQGKANNPRSAAGCQKSCLLLWGSPGCRSCLTVPVCQASAWLWHTRLLALPGALCLPPARGGKSSAAPGMDALLLLLAGVPAHVVLGEALSQPARLQSTGLLNVVL